MAAVLNCGGSGPLGPLGSACNYGGSGGGGGGGGERSPGGHASSRELDSVKIDMRSPGKEHQQLTPRSLEPQSRDSKSPSAKEAEELERASRRAQKELDHRRQAAEERDRMVQRERTRRREEEARREREAAEEAVRRKAEEDAELEADRRAWQVEHEWLRKTADPQPWHRRLLRSLWAGDVEAETPRRRFLFACDLGDPVSSVQLGPGGSCMAGSVQGRVWLIGSQRAGSTAAPSTGRSSRSAPPPPRADLLAGFSDEGCRGLYLDEECGYATFVESCRGWRRSRPHTQVGGSVCFRSLDRKSTQSVKHILQCGPWVCVLFPLSTTLVNVARREHHHRAFKLFDYGSAAEVAPCDFDGEHLALVDRSQLGSGPVFRIAHLERSEQRTLDDLPEAQYISLLKLWNNDCVVCVVGRTLHIYDYRKQQLRYTLLGHSAEIVAVDARSPEAIATVSADGIVKVWSGSTGACARTLHVPGANFYLAYPYCMCMQDQRILISSDEGVWLLELGLQSDVV